MDEKCLTKPGVNGQPTGEGTGFMPMSSRGRLVDLPEGLTEHDLIHLSAQEITDRIMRAGPAVAYPALFRLAAGAGGVPPATQFHAARFLVEHSQELDQARRAALGNALGSMTETQLIAMRDEIIAREKTLPSADEILEAEEVEGVHGAV